MKQKLKKKKKLGKAWRFVDCEKKRDDGTDSLGIMSYAYKEHTEEENKRTNCEAPMKEQMWK